MVVEIYADVVFLLNFSVNGFVLYLTNKLRRKGAKFWRVLLGGAATAALYTVLVFTPLRGFLNVLTSFVILAPGIFVVFRIASLKDFAVTLLVAYVCAFALGGVAMASMYLADTGAGWTTADFAMRRFTPLNLFAAICLTFFVMKFVQRHIVRKALNKQTFCRFRVHLHKTSVEINALVDTGCSLVEPISQSPVVIAEFESIKPLLPPAVAALYQERKQDDLTAIATSCDITGFNTRIRMIPYYGIGSNGVIIGFKPDKIEILDKAAHTTDAVIGICDFALSKDRQYQALMNPLILSS